MNNKIEEIKSYCETRANYVTELKRRLLGPGSELNIHGDQIESEEVISASPKVNYFFGLIYPPEQNMIETDNISQTEEENEEFEVNEENTADEYINNQNKNESDIDSGDNLYDKNDEEDDSIQRANNQYPSSAGFTFFTKKNLQKLELDVEFATYKRCEISDCKTLLSDEVRDNQAAKDILGKLKEIIEYDEKNNRISIKDIFEGSFEEKTKKLRDKLKEITSSSGTIGILEKGNPIKKLLFNSVNSLSYLLYSGHKRCPHTAHISIELKELSDKNIKDYKKSTSIDKTDALVSVVKRRIVLAGAEFFSYTVMLVNESKNKSNVLCQPKIKIVSSKEINDFEFIDYSKVQDLNSLSEEERALTLLYRNKKVYGTGHGAALNWEIDENGYGFIETDFFPQNEVPQMNFELAGKYALNDDEKKVLEMKYLSDLNKDSKENKISLLRKFVSKYETWINDLNQQKSCIQNNLLEKEADNNIELCRESLARMNNGITKLEEDDKAWTSFELTNTAMFMQRIHVKDNKILKDNGFNRFVNKDLNYSKDLPKDFIIAWRPFQLAFLLLSIVSITEDNKDNTLGHDRNIVDLIWFPTGGGKTEAYLGLTAFTIFYRRLTKAAENQQNGTTVIMRYTLRLLTADQFNRAATLICACELIRKKRTDLGTERITIGLWVGDDAAPNKLVDAKTFAKGLSDVKNPDFAKNSKFQIIKCPWCGESLLPKYVQKTKQYNGEHGYVMEYSKSGKLKGMFIKCINANCCFCASTSTGSLPVSVVDEVLYKNPPTLLFGTVDKFAMIAWKSEPGAFFGIGTKNRGPELIIQDELHLISGALGTIVGLYETAIDYLCQFQSGGVKPKIIASTATIRRASEQCKSLYNREMRQFPSPGLESSDSFFAKETEINHEEGLYGRLYVGMMSPKTKDTTEARVIANILYNHLLVFDPVTKKGDLTKKDDFWTLLCYYNTTRELGTARTLLDGIVLQDLNNLSFFNNGKSRNNIYYEELTGQTNSSDLVRIFECLGKSAFDKNGDKLNGKDNVLPPDVALATNMISVGVDISRLNMMLVVGQPKLTSEYIQASSRVGRQTPGVVFSLYNSLRSRDRSHFEQFKQYHDAFYKFVEPTGVTPFAQAARNRGLHGVVVTILRNIINDLKKEDDVEKIIDQNGDISDEIKNAIDAIKKFILERADNIKNENMKSETKEIEKEIDDFIKNYWIEQANTVIDNKNKGGNATFKYGNSYMVQSPSADQRRLLKPFEQVSSDKAKKTMTSMRSVDSQVGAVILI